MKICREGWPFIAGFAGASVLFIWMARSVGSTFLGVVAGICLLGTAFCLYFFRDPRPNMPAEGPFILSPASGRVMQVLEQGDQKIIHIFLSVFDVHVQRAPFRAKVGRVTYKPGKFLDARDPQAAFENEQNEMVLVPLDPSMKQARVTVTQIAGLIARRILCYVKEGDTVEMGQHIGLIRFGSQVDVAFPASWTVQVEKGARVVIGETILAKGN